MSRPREHRGQAALKIQLLPDASAVAKKSAEIIARELWAAVAARGRATLALSRAVKPRDFLRALAAARVPWACLDLFQVDERVAPDDDPERNLKALTDELLARVPLPRTHVRVMPVHDSDLSLAAARYGAVLRAVCGDPPILDVVHLGLGSDGHTASLVPEDPASAFATTEVAVTSPYQGRRRMTLTLPVLNRARRIIWVITGGDKAAALARLIGGDRAITAAHVATRHAIVIADAAAAAQATHLPSSP